MKILIVEDELRLARNVAKALSEVGNFAVDIATDGEDGLHKARTNAYDAIVLDLMLPKVDGLTILKALRSEGHRTPVLVLTAKDSPDDVVAGLDLGSDDYLTKPFEMGELLARCRSLIRRSYDRPDPVLRVGGLQIDPRRRTVQHQGREHVLPAMEFRLLEYLAMRAGEVVSKEDILEHLYDFDAERFSNVIEVYVSSLRKRFGADLIRTLRGQGYSIGQEQP
ncbi:MAG: response regulator transcription factor [Phycisphaerae bacterium]|nr:response regulator transcription factor [Phycisphaerae bacterium]